MIKSTDHEFYQSVPRPVGAMAKLYPARYDGFRHSHPRAQLLYAESGTMKVTTDDGIWVVPPYRAVWFPPNVPHKTGTLSPVKMRTLYIDPLACPPHCPREPIILYVSPLLRELIIRATEMPVEYDERGKDGVIIDLLFREIDWAPVRAVRALELRDSRLRRIEEALSARPDDQRGIEAWASFVGTSRRTLSRLFLKEANTSFHQWRDQFRALLALPRLLEGELIMNVAMDLGYETAGAFAGMFKRVMGMTPSQFLETDRRTHITEESLTANSEKFRVRHTKSAPAA